jgi:hypothetical protein
MTVIVLTTASRTRITSLLSTVGTPAASEDEAELAVTVTIEVIAAWQASTVTVRFRLASAGSERRRMAIKAVDNEVHMFPYIEQRQKLEMSAKFSGRNSASFKCRDMISLQS